MLYFNSSLFNSLSSIFGMTQEAFSVKVFGSKHKYKQRIFFADRLLVIDLVQLCNALHMSISHFFSLSPTNVCAADAEHYRIDGTSFKPISLINSNIKKVYGKDGLANRRLTQLELSQVMGVSQVTLYTWQSNPGQFRVSHLLRMCNLLDVPISLLLKDENVNMKNLEPQNESWRDKELLTELRKIQDITATSQRDIKHLKKELKEYRRESAETEPMVAEDAELNREEVIDEMKKLRRENEELRSEVFRLQRLLDDLRNKIND